MSVCVLLTNSRYDESGISSGLPPWQYGYRQAQRLRPRLGISGPLKMDLVSSLRKYLGSFQVGSFDAPDGIEAIAANDGSVVLNSQLR